MRKDLKEVIMEVKPFKAFRFDENEVGNVGNCIAPPYDVISPEQQEQLYNNCQYNIVRIIEGKKSPSDNNGNNKYSRAADYLNSWIKKGILKQDSAKAIYAYIQNFKLTGTEFQRTSFIALAKLEEYGKTVRPHENTFEEHIIDRLNLKRATAARFGLVFMLYEDKKKIADKIIENAAKQKPLVDFINDQNVRHRLFTITHKDDIHAITKMMNNKNCIIADGHHRYETGLTYLKETSNPEAAYQMMAFVNTCQEGLVILATHRLVHNLENFNAEKLIADLKKNFVITEYTFNSPQTKKIAKQKMLTHIKEEHYTNKNALGIYSGNTAFYVAVLKNKQAMDSVAPEKSKPWRDLDVAVLHKLVLQQLLGITQEQLKRGSNIEYIKDTDNAIDESITKVDAGQKQIAFFMNPVRMEHIKNVTAAGEKMPHKSTYFYPKIYTGLTINKL
ncbi:MAG: DUF1015 domain-containing protein [Planctomycetota bacterium]|nr:MAG: DUF1015 domain-containing protein [Planctomycetota bacterium]